MITAIIVEDDPSAARRLAAALRRTGRIEILGEVSDAVGGLRLCRRAGVDVVFLKVRLPGTDGLSFARAVSRLPEPPLCVFVTSHAEYAVEAFRIHAADYLLTPLEPRRVEDSVRHLEQRLRERRACPTESDDGTADRLPVRLRECDVARLVARREIVAALRRGRLTWIHTKEAEYRSYHPLCAVESWLGGSPFFRAARDSVVNMNRVTEIVHYGDRLYQLHLEDRPQTIVKVSRSAASSLSSLLRPPL